MTEPLVCVVVCVHNALADVRRCLASVMASDYPSERLRMVIVDDGSNRETERFLQDFAASGSAKLIRHGTARGYTLSANEGIKARGEASFVVLLNSDTIVPQPWLRRMLAVFDGLPDVGIVGPLSNAATWQSVPEYRNDTGGWAANDLPEGWSIAQVDELIHSLFAAMPRIPRVPVLNGFCLMIRADLFERLGLLDAEAFPRGYGEENDFCFRATDAGFGLAIATNCFVFHAKSKSFGTETRQELARLARERLIEKYGEGRFLRASRTMKAQPVLADIRAKVAIGLARDPLYVEAGADGGPDVLRARPPAVGASGAREINPAEQPLVHVIGLQRSGTNFLVELIRHNVTDRILPTGDRTLSWKHAVPDERRGAALPAREAVLQSEALVCLISKNPVQWVSSVLRSDRHDLFIKRPELLGGDGKPDISKIVDFYCRFHSLWIEVLEHRLTTTGFPYALTRYEDLLDQPADVLNGIATLLRTSVAADINVPARVPYSAKTTPDDLDRFKRGEHALSDDEVSEVMLAAHNCESVKRLGYAL